MSEWYELETWDGEQWHVLRYGSLNEAWHRTRGVPRGSIRIIRVVQGDRDVAMTP